MSERKRLLDPRFFEQKVPRRDVLRGVVSAATVGAGLILTASQPVEIARNPEAGGVVNTLDYFINNYHKDRSLVGDHVLSQKIVDKSSFYFKDRVSFEKHTWNGENICLELDRNGDKRIYGFAAGSGIWMKQRMQIGEPNVVKPDVNEIRWYNKNCEIKDTDPYGFTNTLEAHYPRFDVGGDLGIQEVIQLRYQPHGGNPERYYYSREWGWIGWEELNPSNDSVKHQSIFNKVASKKFQIQVDKVC